MARRRGGVEGVERYLGELIVVAFGGIGFGSEVRRVHTLRSMCGLLGVWSGSRGDTN
jgi:hypothetical protein